MNRLTNLRLSGRMLIAALAVGACCAAFCHHARADAVWNNVGAGDWNTGANWTGGTGAGGVPGNDPVRVNNGGTAQITAALTNPNIQNFILGQNAGQTGTVTQSVGTLTAGSGNSIVGANGTGFYTINSGSLTLTNNEFHVGEGATGKGTFTQNAGSSVSFGRRLKLGQLAGSEGTYNLDGGSLLIGTAAAAERVLMVGESGKGTFNHAAPTSLTLAQLIVGQSNMANGTYNLSAAATINTDLLQVGLSTGATGTFNQFTGSVNAGTNNQPFKIGQNGTGTYTISGGSLTFVGNQPFIIGESGSGTFHTQGSAPTLVSVANLDLRSANDTLRYTLDNGGVRMTTVTGNVNQFDGALDVDLLGGAALLSSTSHQLVSSPNNFLNGGDQSSFSEGLWNKTSAANPTNNVTVALDPADKKGTFALGGETGPFAAANQGWVEINGLTPGSPVDIQLDVNTVSPLMDLIDFLNTNGGLAAAASSVGDPFDIMLTVDPTAADSFFAWDFSDFDTLAGNSVPTTVQNVSTVVPAAAAVPEPAGIAIWTMLGLGLGAYGYRRRQRRT